MTINHPRAPEARSRNTFIAIFICMAAGIILAGILHYRSFEAQYRVKVGHELSAVASLKAEEVRHYRETQMEYASLFVNNPSFSGLAKRYFSDPLDQDAKKQILAWLGRLKDSGSFDRIRLLDARGATRLSVPPALPDITPFISRHAAETMRTGRADCSGFYRNAVDNRIYLSLAAPILDANSGRGPLGMLVLRTDPLKYLYPMMQRWPTPSPTAENLLVSRDGNDALFLSPSRSQGDIALKMRIPLSRTDTPAVRAVLGRTGVAEGVDYRGVPVLADTRPIPGSPWFIVTRIDISEFQAPLREQLWVTIVFIVSLLAGAGAALAFVWKQRNAGFYRGRYEAMEALRESDESLRRAQGIAKLGSWRYSLSGRISWSDELYRVYGVSPETFTPTVESLIGLIHPEDRPAMAEWLRACGAGEKPDELVFRAVHPDGAIRFISGRGELVYGPDGKPAYMAGTAQDITERKMAETALREKNEKINLLLDSAAEAIYGLDRDGNCNFCNNACLRLLGYKRPEELLGKNMHWQIHSKRTDGTPFPIEDCRIFQAFRKGEGARVDDEVLWRSDGTSFSAEYWTYPMLRDGEVVGAVVSFLDITGRKKAEAALQENYRQLSAAQELAHLGSWELDLADNRLTWSDEVYRIFGLEPQEFPASYAAFLEAVHPEDRAAVDAAYTNSLREGRDGYEIEHRVVWKRTGEVRIVYEKCQHIRDGSGRIVKSAGMVQDITGSRKAEQELRKLSLAVTESPSSIVITDDKGAIEFVNRRFTEITGYSFEEARGQNPCILKSGAQPPEFYKELWKTISSGEIWRGEFHNKKKNGQLYWESAAIAPITDARGTITNYLAVKENITERKRLEAELIKAKDAAEAANRAKSAFLANMSHEIRTPMNAILGFSQLMRRDPAATPKQKQQIETINRSGEHLLALINDILEMSKAEAGRATLNPSAFDLHALIDDVGNMLRPRAVIKGLRLEVVRSAGLPRFVTADEGKLRQILLNLLVNALKFTEKGAVALRLAARPGAERESQLTAEVEDTGPGISPQELAMLFRPFEQAQVGRAAGGGTGLGLAISRDYVRLMGGDITVKSQPGKGSVFSFNIALKEASQPAASQKAQPRQVKGLKPGQQQYRVLVADDKEDNREFLAQLLGPAGFDVRQAADGEAALKEFKAWQPQIILMDLQMPGMDGYEALRRIRAGAGGREAKIIAVTASVFGETNREATGAGADDLILKPFRESELFEKIQNLLGAEYIYAEEAPAAIAGPADTGMLRSSLAGLPPELISQLRKAVYNGDFDRLAELAGQVEEHDISLAVMLRSLAGEFDLQGILALLGKETHDR